MKAWLLENIGDGIDNLRLADVPDPAPGPGEVLVEVRYAALNPADRYLAEGQYPAKPVLPHILGRDGMGKVVALGASAAGDVRVGDKVLLLRGETGINKPGMFAQRCAVPIDSLASVPQGWSDEQAAGASVAYISAHQALLQWGPLPPSVVLVTGASGGVGVATVQLASALGHTVVGLSRDPQKSARLREMGASLMFDPADREWRRKLKEQLGKRRVDLAVDNIGGPLFSEVIDTLGDRGRVSVVGRLAGAVHEFNTASLIFRRIRIGGVQVGAYSNAETRAAWNEILAWLAKTGAKPVVDRVFAFDQLKDAFNRLAQGPMGKVLVKVDG